MGCICKACEPELFSPILNIIYLRPSSLQHGSEGTQTNSKGTFTLMSLLGEMESAYVFLSVCERVCSGPLLSCAVSDKRTMAAGNTTPAGGTACMVEHI